MRGAGSKNSWALFLLILAGLVLGGFIGMLAEGSSAVGWLAYGQTFGVEKPIILDLGILIITFGLTIKITISSIIGIVLATGIYMVFGNCFGAISAIQINLQAIILTAILVASMFGYRHFAKKKLSPILLIVLSAIAGMAVYGI